MSVVLSEALDTFSDHLSDITSECQINIMHVIRTHPSAAVLDVDKVWTKEDILAEADRLAVKEKTSPMIRVMNAINRRNAPPVYGRITNEMIEQAREYPMEELLAEYGVEIRRGMARCPWHDDRLASLSIHQNKAHCFGGCGRFDTIDVVMREERLNFPQAVKRLCK